MNIERRINLLIGTFIALCIYGLFFLNIASPNLWFDEAGQFWISQGLNHDSAPMSLTGGVKDVIKNNRFYNMDPGGFSILLHFWGKASTAVIWLKTLPMLFFISAMFFYCWCIYLASKNIILSLYLSIAPLLIPSISNMGFELRAYSMEMLGTVLCAYFLIALTNKITSLRLALVSLVFSLFMFSRYAEVLVTFSASLYILSLIILRKDSLTKKIQEIAIYSLPLIVTVVIIYIVSMQYQNPKATNLFYLTYLKHNPSVLLSKFNFFYLGFQFILIALIFLMRKKDSCNNLRPILFLL